jgi:transmembrane sensor
MSARPVTDPASPEAPIDPAIVRRACEWMARLWSDEAGDADKAACERWRAEHPDHERAWRRLQVVEDRLYSVPREVARHVLREPAAKAHTRRRALRLLGLGVAAGGIAWAARDEMWRMGVSGYSTRTGEIREIALPDGTRVTLASASAVAPRFNERERLLILRAGEILVSTASDPRAPSRPLRVQNRHGVVWALGTRFTVRQNADVSRVAVLEGAVEVRPLRGAENAVRIGAGQELVFSAERARAPETLRENAAAWLQGVLVAENMRVGEFVAELARYRPGLLRCDPAVADLRVTGVFSLRDTDRALSNLALALPVAVAYRSRYWVTVRAR